MEVIDLELPGVRLIRGLRLRDERGFFQECYQKSQYKSFNIECEFVQDNLSFSKPKVIRGMHFQSSPGQAKLVSVVQGSIFDVVVDIRPTSSCFGKWIGVHLASDLHEQLFIPVGFAHGFCVTGHHGAYVSYKVSSVYDSSSEKSFRFDDPDIGIKWPISDPIISDRDRTAPFFKGICL